MHSALPMSNIFPTALSTFDIARFQSMPGEKLTARILEIRKELGKKLLILGHHYQQDEVIALSDLRGDSYQLASLAS
jgi:quinolinate synthase